MSETDILLVKFAELETRIADRDQAMVEKIAKIEIRMADRDKELIKWFVGIAFALFLANAAVTNFILKPQFETPAPVTISYPAPAPASTNGN